MDFGIDLSDLIDVDSLADALGNLPIDVSNITDLTSDIIQNAAPVLSMFNPVLGAGIAASGALLNAIRDGQVSPGEVFDIGQSVIESQGLGQFAGIGYETFFGAQVLAEQQAAGILEKLINDKPVTQQDVDVLGDLVSMMNLEGLRKSKRSGSKGGSEGGDSIFQVIAEIFGEKMKAALGEMLDLADQIKGADKDDVAGLTTEFQAVSQQFSFLSQSFNTGINSLGEGLKAAARKQ